LFEKDYRPILALVAGFALLVIVVTALLSIVDHAVGGSEKRLRESKLLSPKGGSSASAALDKTGEDVIPANELFDSELEKEAKGIAKEVVKSFALKAKQSAGNGFTKLDKIGRSATAARRKEDLKKRVMQNLLQEASSMAVNSNAEFPILLEIANYQEITADNQGAELSLESATDMVLDSPAESFSKDLAKVSRAEVEFGNIQRAVALSRQIPDAKYQSSVLSTVSEKQAQRGAFDRAMQTASIIPDKDWRAAAFSSLATWQAKSGDVKGAQATARTLVDSAVRSRVLNRIAITIVRFHPWESARSTLSMIPNQSEKSAALGDIAASVARKGRFHSADRLLGLISNGNDKKRALHKMIEAQARLNEIATAKRTATHLVDDADQDKAMKTISYAQARRGDFAGAMATAAQINDFQIENAAISAIATTQALKRDAIGSRATARRISNKVLKENTLRDIAIMEARIGDLADAQQTAHMIGLSEPRAAALTGVATYLARSGEGNRALANLLEASSAAGMIENQKSRDAALLKIASAQARAKQSYQAKVTLTQIEDIRQLSKAHRAVASSMAASGDVPGAIRTAYEIQEPKQQQGALVDIARLLGKETPIAEAHGQLASLESAEEKIQFVLAVAERNYPKSRYRKTGLEDPNDRATMDRAALRRQLAEL
jgi:hypothetical protein